MHLWSYCEGVFDVEMEKNIPSLSSNMILIYISDYYGTQVFFFFAMLVSPFDVISCEVINVKNFLEVLRYIS